MDESPPDNNISERMTDHLERGLVGLGTVYRLQPNSDELPGYAKILVTINTTMLGEHIRQEIESALGEAGVSLQPLYGAISSQSNLAAGWIAQDPDHSATLTATYIDGQNLQITVGKPRASGLN